MQKPADIFYFKAKSVEHLKTYASLNMFLVQPSRDTVPLRNDKCVSSQNKPAFSCLLFRKMEDKHASTPVGKIENPENIAKAPKHLPPPPSQVVLYSAILL